MIFINARFVSDNLALMILTVIHLKKAY